MVSGLGIKSVKADGNDPQLVYKTYLKAKKYVKKNDGPIFLEFKTFRHFEHCGYLKDDHLKNLKLKEQNVNDGDN